jgi:peptidoglycan/LPS O-acetylase OafA/YrhL
MTPVPTPPDLRALTTLRFLAALWVVLYTAWPHLDVGFVPVAVTKGYLGVETFFILSGFCQSHAQHIKISRIGTTGRRFFQELNGSR